MKNLISISVLIIFLASCSKNDPDTNPDPIPIPIIPDTLSVGWAKATNVAPSLGTSDIFFTNANSGFVTSQSGIYKSLDGGINWTFFNANNKAYNIGGFGTKFCFVGDDNRISYTTNTTDFFSPIYNLANPGSPALNLIFRDCFFSSQNVVYACSNSHIYKSANGGVSFDSIYVFPSGNLCGSIFFVNDIEGWLIRTNGLFKTIDGGLNWTLSLPISPQLFGSIDFISSTVGVFSDNSTVYKTIDGGVNWTPIYSGFSNVFVDVDMISANEIYISGGSKIYKTTNGGTSWSQVLSSGQNGIIEIHFIDANTGWACGGNGAIYRYKL